MPTIFEKQKIEEVCEINTRKLCLNFKLSFAFRAFHKQLEINFEELQHYITHKTGSLLPRLSSCPYSTTSFR